MQSLAYIKRKQLIFGDYGREFPLFQKKSLSEYMLHSLSTTLYNVFPALVGRGRDIRRFRSQGPYL